MDLNLLKDDKVPLTVSEDILGYLQEQTRDDGEEGPSEVPRLTNFTEAQIRGILGELLEKFEKKQRIKETYQARVDAHNQHDLVDMKSVIEDFEIDDAMYEALTFRETVIIFRTDNDNSQIPVGGLCLDIQKAPGRQTLERKQCDDIDIRLQRIFNKEHKDVVKADEVLEHKTKGGDESSSFNIEDDLKKQAERNTSKFLVHVSSQFDMNGSTAGSAITGWVDRCFHTVEELRREFYMSKDKKTIEKDLYVGLVKRFYYVKHISNVDDIDDRKFYSLAKAEKYISEGCNFLLQRYLAITRYYGVFELSAMYINGDMCRNIYDCSGLESDLVNEYKLDVCKIERTIIEECGLEHKCITILTLQGQIVRQEWEDSPYILQVNPLAKVKNEKPTGNEQVLLKHTWEGDMQLFSHYLDEKVKTEMRIKSYMIDQPEFKNIIFDYINAILLLKPEDVLNFTLNHFMSFSPRFMPMNDYFD